MTLEHGKVTVTSLLPILGTVSGSMALKELADSKPQTFATTMPSSGSDSGSSSGTGGGTDKGN
jgi:hypothetical protein